MVLKKLWEEKRKTDSLDYKEEISSIWMQWCYLFMLIFRCNFVSRALSSSLPCLRPSRYCNVLLGVLNVFQCHRIIWIGKCSYIVIQVCTCSELLCNVWVVPTPFQWVQLWIELKKLSSILMEGSACIAYSYSSSLRARKPLCSSMKSETIIPDPFPFGFIILLPFSPHCKFWSSLDWNVLSSWKCF